MLNNPTPSNPILIIIMVIVIVVIVSSDWVRIASDPVNHIRESKEDV